MATLNDVRKICANLPGAVEGEDQFGFSVENKGKAKGFLWTWKERINPKEARVPNKGVLAVMVPNLATKEIILASDPEKFFTEPHYNGFPAVLVRLKAIRKQELEDLIIEAWRCKAPKNLVREFEEGS